MIKKGDTVTIRTGKDVGKTGIVSLVIPSENRAIVAGINLVKHHLKKSPKHPAGGIHSTEAPVHISNVMIVCPNCKKPAKTGSKKIDDNTYRVCKNCDQAIDKKAKS